MRLRFAFVAIACALSGAAACDSSSTPAEPAGFTARGSWSGQEANGPTRVMLQLTQRGDSVYGTGTLSGGEGSTAPDISVKVGGFAVDSRFEIKLSAPTYAQLVLSGVFKSRDQVQAYMFGSGYLGEPMLLTRD